MRFLIALFLLLFLVRCAGNEPETYDTIQRLQGSLDDAERGVESFEEIVPPQSAELPPPPAPDQTSAPSRSTAGPQKIIYTAQVRAQVQNLDSALARVQNLVAQASGYLSSQHRTNSSYRHSADLTIRLPAEQLSSTLDALSALVLVTDYQNLDSRNVTTEWLDLETRLQTKRDVRDRYIEILRERATKVEDILNAEEKIRVITEEIESREGRLRYLRDQVSLSTLTLELYETKEYAEGGEVFRKSYGSKLGEAFGSSFALLGDLFLGFVATWPLWLIITLTGWLVVRWVRHHR